MSNSVQPLSIYLHIPYCKAKCTYCDFYSLAGQEHSIPVFTEQLRKEIALFKDCNDLSPYQLDTIFFGGGTPNLIPPDLLEGILDQVLGIASPTADMEIGMEVNPGEATLETLKAYHALGMNRLSIGMQSFQPQHLKFMSRIHDPQDSIRTFEAARTAGFSNVNADLIFAIPGQTRQVWRADLETLVALGPEHISTYSLTVEAGTALHRWVEAGHVQMLKDTVDTGMYREGREYLESQGYANYEISNHARKGFACRHNMNYWTGVSYLGFGPSAHSYFEKRRFWNVRSLDQYIKAVAHAKLPVEGSEDIDPLTAGNEMILTRLRLSRGLDLEQFKRTFQKDLLIDKADMIKKWNRQLRVESANLSLNPDGWALVDEITSDLMY